MAVVLTVSGILANEYLIDFAAWLPSVATVISNGLLPASLVLAVIVGFYGWIKKKYKTTNNETVQAVFVLVLTAFVILTITGIWFRGTGMALTWLW